MEEIKELHRYWGIVVMVHVLLHVIVIVLEEGMEMVVMKLIREGLLIRIMLIKIIMNV